MINPLINTRFNVYNKTFTSPSFRQKSSDNSVKLNNPKTLSSQNNTLLSDLIYSYNQIQSVLDKKTFYGIRSLVLEHKGFTTNDGLTFKNVTEDGDSISFDVKSPKVYNNFVRILVKDKNNKVKEGYLIKNNLYVVKNYDISQPDKIPENPEIYTIKEAENLDLDKKINNILQKTDEAMFDVRKFVNKRKDSDIKSPAGILSKPIQNKMQNILDTTEKLKETISDIPSNTLNRYKSEYKDYCFKNGQTFYMFQNIGNNKEKIVFTSFNSSIFGKMEKLLVYNQDDSLKTGYMFKDGKVVSNFNTDYPTNIPEKLSFVDSASINDKRYTDELNSYLTLYQEKLEEFKTFMSKKKRLAPLSLTQEDKKSLDNINKLYEMTQGMLNTLPYPTILKIKSQYDDFNLDAPKRGITLKNVGEDGRQYNVTKIKTHQKEICLRITAINPDNTDGAVIILKSDNSIVKSHRTSQEEMAEKLQIINDLDKIKEKMDDFNSFVKNKVDFLNKRAVSKAVIEQDGSVSKRAVLQAGKQRTKIVTGFNRTQHNELIKDFHSILKNMNNDISVFDASINNLREKVLQYLSEIKNLNDNK